MSSKQKLRNKFMKKPVPNDITMDEVETFVKAYGCIFSTGGNHQKRVVYKPLGRIIPIPDHGRCVKEAYIKKIKDLILEIEEMEKSK